MTTIGGTTEAADPVKNALRNCASRAVELQATTQHNWTTGSFEKALFADASFAAAVSAFRADPEIAPRLDKRFACAIGGISELRASEVIRAFVRNCLRSSNGRNIDEAIISNNFEQLAKVVRKGKLTGEVNVTIEHLVCDAGTFAIGGFTFHGTQAGKVFAINGAKGSVPIGLTPKDSTEEAYNQLDGIRIGLCCLLDLIRLVTAKSFSAPRFDVYVHWPNGAGTGNGAILSPCHEWLSGAHLSSAGVAEVGRRFEALKSSSRYTKIALRRLGLSRCEFDPDERVFDLISAAEALFLSGELTESAHKLALRCAFFIGVADNRRAIYRVMKAAYNVRSKIAHGDSADKIKRPDLAGKAIGRHEFAQVVDGLISAAISKSISEGTPKPDWEAMLFDDCADSGETSVEPN